MYDALEAAADRAICKRFGLHHPDGAALLIKRADSIALWAEMRDLRGKRADGGMSADYHEARGLAVSTMAREFEAAGRLVPRITPMSPDVARSTFLRRLASLRPDMGIRTTWEPEA